MPPTKAAPPPDRTIGAGKVADLSDARGPVVEPADRRAGRDA